jgi:SagB-type dehydrogenase family enzyme
MDERIRANREILKSNFPLLRQLKSDQDRHVPQPRLEKPVPPGAQLVDLPAPDAAPLAERDIHNCLKRRRSRRTFNAAPLTLDQLAFLLWATQGVQRVFGDNYSTFRPAPSGGARHPFETYLIVNRVDHLAPGVYRYLPLSHRLQFVFADEALVAGLHEAVMGQTFVGDSAVVFAWSCIPYRTEWRYHVASAKLVLLDAGHLCQNLYLACEAIGCGMCAVAAYDQALIDRLLRLDGVDEFVVYLAPVGKVGRDGHSTRRSTTE